VISVVVIGRNDSHGYNLSKRVASSLNNISLLMRESDEIVFVDWNSDDCNPTFIDAIGDTLTEKTKQHLIVYRVRESVHKKFSINTKTPILEPIARNVGIRRAKNDWILSTNTDMLFNIYENSFHKFLSDLNFGLYHLYRYELPEYIWDTFDRSNPESTYIKIQKIGSDGQLVRRIMSNPYKGSKSAFPDGVGDFQLATKALWASVKGFPEDMLKGWHVDSRLSAAIESRNSINAQIIDNRLVQGFHQNHLRMQTHFHHSNETNAIELVGKSYENSNNWGLADFDLECSTLANRFSLVYNYETRDLESPSDLESEVKSLAYNENLICFFICNELINLPKSARVLISSSNDLDVNISKELKAVLEGSNSIQLQNDKEHTNFADFDLIVLDFGIFKNYSDNRLTKPDLEKYLKIIERNIFILSNLSVNTRVIYIRANHWGLRGIVRHFSSTQLMNNYSLQLSGNIKTIDKKIRFISRMKVNLLVSFFLNDLHSMLDIPNFEYKKLFRKNLLFKILSEIYFRMPSKVRGNIRRVIVKLLDIT
jgi:hypothetical protein